MATQPRAPRFVVVPGLYVGVERRSSSAERRTTTDQLGDCKPSSTHHLEEELVETQAAADYVLEAVGRILDALTQATSEARHAKTAATASRRAAHNVAKTITGASS